MFAAVFTALCAGIVLGFVVRDRFAAAHVCTVDTPRDALTPLSPYRCTLPVERIEIECKRPHVDELPRDYNPFAMPQPMTLPPIGPASRVRE